VFVPLLLLAGAGFAAYEWIYKPSKAKTAPPSNLQTNAAPLAFAHGVANTPAAVAGVVAQAGTKVPAALAAVAPSLSDPVAAIASFTANALLHGSATDPAVQAQVKAFQLAAGVTPADGKYGPITQAKLRSYVPGAPPAPAVYGGTG